MYWDGSAWQPYSTGGGASPGGVTNSLQYNNGAGGFGGEAALTYDPATNTLTVDNIGSHYLTGPLNVPRGQNLWVRNGALARWAVYGDSSAESGGNVSTDFWLVPYDDAGAQLGGYVRIERAGAKITHQLQNGASGLVHGIFANANGPCSISLANANTGASAQARLDLATGTAAAYSLMYVQDGATPYMEISHGVGLTGGMWFSSAAGAPIVFRHSGTERLRLTGARIQADFTSAPSARSYLQTNALNSATDVGAIPQGTSGNAAFSVYGSSDPVNSSIGSFDIASGDAVSIESVVSGSGTLLPIKLKVGGTTTLGTDGASAYLPALSEPAAPSASNVRLFGYDIATKTVPAWKNADGVMTPAQASLAFGYQAFSKPSATTVIQSMGLAMTNGGTLSTFTLASTNKLTQTRRYSIASAAGAGSLAMHYGSLTEVWRGNAAGLGGFTYACRFHLSTMQAGQRAFVGLVDVIAAPTNIDPTTSTTPGKVGLAINTNSGNWNLVYNVTGAAPTVVALGASFPVDTTTLLELFLYCPGGGGNINYRISNISTGVSTSGTLTTNIPSTTTFLARSAWITNNTTAAAVAMGFCGQYIESPN